MAATSLVGFDKGFNPLPSFQSAGFRPTSGYRTQAHQDALRAQGLTKTNRSQHTMGNAVDFAIPRGWSKARALEWAKQNFPGARFEATNGNSIHGTFPGWGSAPDVSNSRGRYR